MSLSVHSVTIDCRNAYELSEWWKPVLGYADIPDDPNEPSHPECAIVDPAGVGQTLLFITVPEPKTVKNRLHLDLQPEERTRDEEVSRLLELGATLHEDHRNADGTGWATLLDPEGNEFCVLRSQAERAQTRPVPD